MTKTTVRIDGMMCSMCESHVCDAAKASLGAKKVKASHKTGLLEMVTEKEPLEADIRKAIEEVGFSVLGVESEPYVKKWLFGF